MSQNAVNLDGSVIPLPLPGPLPMAGSAGVEASAPATAVVDLADELSLARRVQRSLLLHNIPKLPGWDVGALCFTAGPIGGDLYHAQALNGAQALYLVADVMGKGIPAALIASVLRAVTRNAAEGAGGPAEILVRVNELMYEDLSNADMYVTMQVLWLDILAGALHVANAGHCPLLARRKRDATVEAISATGIPIGVAPRFTYSEESLAIPEYDLFLQYTDGVTETRNPLGDTFGQERLVRWMAEADCSEAQVLAHQLVGELRLYEEARPPKDDQTVLILRSKGL